MYVDPYTISLAVVQYMKPPFVYKRPDDREFLKKVENDKQRVTETKKGQLLDTYA